MAEDAELSDLILKAFLARRKFLQTGEGARSIEILGTPMSTAAHTLRNWAARQQLPHMWFDFDSPEGKALAAAHRRRRPPRPAGGRDADRGPAATRPPARSPSRSGCPTGPSRAGCTTSSSSGAGPGGLAAAVYGASEGLDTMLLDAVAVGGQAAASSRIENYLGFPFGLTGADLTARAELQAQKFGAQVSTPCTVTQLHTERRAAAAHPRRRHRDPDPRRRDRDRCPLPHPAARAMERLRRRRHLLRRHRARGAGPARPSRSRSSAARTRPARPRSTWPTAAARSTSWSVARTSPPGCRATSSTGWSPIRGSGSGWRPRSPALYGDESLAQVSTTTRRGDEERLDVPRVVLLHRRAAGDRVAEATWTRRAVALDEDGFVFTDQQLDDASSATRGRCSAAGRCRSRPASRGCSPSVTSGTGR